ncbi:MAG: hypothetical protein ACYTG3_20045 [Planctomycetota bacterium]
MRFRIILTIGALAFGLAACGGNSHEAIMDEQLDLMDEMLDILEGVNDEASANEAAKKIEALTEDMQKLAKRAQELGEPTPEQQKRLEEIGKERQEEFSKRMQAVMMKVMQYPELQQAFTEAGQSMQK